MPTRTFEDYDLLAETLAPLEAIKVATWWQTALPVWEASVGAGIPVYFVQDIETSYYDHDPEVHGRVLTSYRPEFTFLTTSTWVHDELRKWAPDATIIAPGLDTVGFHEIEGEERQARELLAVGRANPLKNFPLTRDAWLALAEPRPTLRLFGVEPEVAAGLPAGVEYEVRPSDAELNRLMNRCTAFVQTSKHEGFCLPILEAMSAGAPVVCTDADGNRDFCVDGENCLMPASDVRSVAAALQRVLDDPELRARLVAGGRRTADAYAWPNKLDELDAFFRRVADERSRGEMPVALPRGAS